MTHSVSSFRTRQHLATLRDYHRQISDYLHALAEERTAGPLRRMLLRLAKDRLRFSEELDPHCVGMDRSDSVGEGEESQPILNAIEMELSHVIDEYSQLLRETTELDLRQNLLRQYRRLTEDRSLVTMIREQGRHHP